MEYDFILYVIYSCVEFISVLQTNGDGSWAHRIFEIGSVFRANPSFTSRHDTEFTSIDVEISWIESYEDVMNLEESLLHHTLSRIAEMHGAEIKE